MQDLRTNHNLVNSIAERVGRPKGFYKAAAMDAILSVLLMGFGFVSRLFILGSLSIWYMAALAGLTALALLVHAMMPVSPERRYGTLAAGATLFSLSFYDFKLWAFAASAAVAYIFLMAASMSARREIDKTLEIRYSPIFRAVFGQFITGFCIVGVILFASLRGIGMPITESTFDPIYRSSTGLVAKFYPAAVLNGTVKEFGESMARSEAEASPDFGRLPKSAQDDIIKQGSRQIILGLGIKEKDQNVKLSSVAYGWVSDFIDNVKESVGPYYVFLWSVVFFLIVRSFGALLTYILYPLGWLTYETLIAAGFYSMQGESRMKEVIKF